MDTAGFPAIHVRRFPRTGLPARWLAALCLAASIIALSGCLYAGPPDPTGERAAATRAFEDPKLRELAIAAGSGNVAAVQRLMRDEGVDPDGVFWGRDSGTPMLAWPIHRGNPDGLRAMLEAGADPNVAKPYPVRPGRTQRAYPNAMVWAAQQADSAYLEILLDHGGNPDTRNANNEALLFHAYIHGNLWRNVELLVLRGADVDVQASPGRTILTSYAGRGGFQSVLWLLERGADPALQFSFDVPVQRRDSHAIRSIFWHPGNPDDAEWQIKCQRWLLANGYERPPMPEHYRKMRETFGFPHTENEIPLPDMDDDGGRT